MVTCDSRDNGNIFWTLAVLMTDFSVEVTPREVRRFAPPTSILPAGTRVGLATRIGFRSTRTNAAATALISSGMRPVLPLTLLDAGDRHQLDRALATWEHMGVDDLAFDVGVAHDLAPVLDRIVDTLNRPGFRRRGFLSVGVRVGGFRHRGARTLVTESADLLRALDAAKGTALDLGIDLYLTTTPTASVHRLLRWEQSLRAAGNRLPIRVGLPGPWGTDLLPRWRPASPGKDRLRLVLGLAAALAHDPDSQVRSVHLFPAGALPQCARWALDVHKGNFVIEDDPDHGHRVTTLG